MLDFYTKLLYLSYNIAEYVRTIGIDKPREFGDNYSYEFEIGFMMFKDACLNTTRTWSVSSLPNLLTPSGHQQTPFASHLSNDYQAESKGTIQGNMESRYSQEWRYGNLCITFHVHYNPPTITNPSFTPEGPYKW